MCISSHHRSYLAGVAVLAAALTISASQLLGADAQATGAGFGAAVVFTPVQSNLDTYLCTAEITDLGSGTVISAPRVQIKKGSSGKVRSGAQDSAGKLAWQVDLEVSIDSSATTARYTVTYTTAGQAPQSQMASLTIR